MKTYKKKNFLLNKSLTENQNVDEFVDSEGAMLDGNRTVTNNSEIETGPVTPPSDDNSGYEKGVSTTTDRAARYRQPRNWFSNFGAYGGTPYSHGERNVYSVMAESNKIEELVEDILNKKSNDNEVVRKYVDTDINKNQIPDLKDLSNPAAASKTKEFLDVIKNNNLNGEQIAIMLNYILTNLPPNSIPQNIKQLIIKKL